MILLRSLMFVPGNNPRFIDNAPNTGADLICLDLEDAVAPGDKAQGREMVREALPRVARPGQYLLFVRVNGLDTGLLEEDLLAVVRPDLDGISLPKAHRPEIVRQVDHYLTILEIERGLSRGQVKIIPWIESAEGVLNAQEVCRASPRLLGASFGGEDYSTDMQVQRTRASKEIEWARYQVAIACRAANIIPIDVPELDFRDLDHLEEACRFVRGIGYQGKYCIHPTQVEIVNRLFAPSEEELARARQVIVAYEEGERQGRGAVELHGTVVDRPIYTRALALVRSVTGEEG